MISVSWTNIRSSVPPKKLLHNSFGGLEISISIAKKVYWVTVHLDICQDAQDAWGMETLRFWSWSANRTILDTDQLASRRLSNIRRRRRRRKRRLRRVQRKDNPAKIWGSWAGVWTLPYQEHFRRRCRRERWQQRRCSIWYKKLFKVEIAKCRGGVNKRVCINASSCEGDYGAPLIQVPLSLL